MLSVALRVPAGRRIVVLAVPSEPTVAVTGFPTIVAPSIRMKITLPEPGFTEPLVMLALSVTDCDEPALKVAAVPEATIVVAAPRATAVPRGEPALTVGRAELSAWSVILAAICVAFVVPQ